MTASYTKPKPKDQITTTAAPDKKKMSTTAKVLIGVGLLAVIAGGAYLIFRNPTVLKPA